MNKYMKIANDLAWGNLETNAGGPFGACVVKDGKIIGRGANNVLLDEDPTAHAEIVAIREACKKLGTYDLCGCELFATCYPCPMCLAAIIWANIRKVYYGNSKEDAAEIGFRDDFIYGYMRKLVDGKDDSGVLNLENIDREETIKAFKMFEQKSDKTIY